MHSAADSKKIHQLLFDRCERMLHLDNDVGFGYEQAKTCTLKSVEVEGVDLVGEDDTAPQRGAQAITTVETVVDQSCCNPMSNAHGGYLAWLIDHCSSLSLIALAGNGRWLTSGVSTNINTFYISAAPVGTKLAVITSVLQQGKSSAVLEIRVENAETGKLVAFGTHVKQDVVGKPKL